MSTPTTSPRSSVDGAPDRADVEMVLAFARRMGVSAEDLAVSAARVPVPTFGDYLPRVIARMPAPSCRIYGPYWTRIVAAWEQRRLDEPDEADILALRLGPDLLQRVQFVLSDQIGHLLAHPDRLLPGEVLDVPRVGIWAGEPGDQQAGSTGDQRGGRGHRQQPEPGFADHHHQPRPRGLRPDLGLELDSRPSTRPRRADLARG